MSKVSTSRVYNMDAIAFGEALLTVASTLKLGLRSRMLKRIELVEQFSLVKLTRAASLIAIVEPSGNRVLVSFTAETPGVGPIASGHSNSVLQKVISALSSYE